MTPDIGDIIVYVGDSAEPTWKRRREEKLEYIVLSTAEADHEHLKCYALSPGERDAWGGDDVFYPQRGVVRVVRKATYTTLLGPDHEAVKVSDTDSGWLVMGDVNELLEGATHHQLDVFHLANSDATSANYAIIPWAQRTFPRADIDCESSCFYAYLPDEATARKLAAAINAREWMVPASELPATTVTGSPVHGDHRVV